MNLYSAVNKIGEILDSNELINSIYNIAPHELDQCKFEDFPMANIQIAGMDLQTEQITFEVSVLFLRDTSKTQDRFTLDNRWENFSEARYILTELIRKLYYSRDIEFVGATPPTIIYNEFANGLDGLTTEITLFCHTHIDCKSC